MSKKSTDHPVNVICMKWGTKYGPEYVNRLYAGVRRHLSLPHRFICFTDSTEGLEPGIETRPLPSLGLPPGLPERGWTKLATFADPLSDIEGVTLFLDVDVIITGSLDVFFEIEGPFFIMKDFNPRSDRIGNSSVYRFVAGAHPDVLAYFVANFEKVRTSVRNEQEYLTNAMEERGLLAYWPTDWAVSYKKRCIPKFPRSLWQAPAPPPETRIIIFHGHPKPEEAMVGKGNKFYRPALAAPWVGKAWYGEE